MSTATLAFDIIGRDKASPAFGKVGKAADQSSSKMSKLGAMSGKAKAGLAGLAAIAGGTLVAGLFDATGAASDLNETMSKVNVLFGKRNAKMLEKWASGAAKALGQSKQTALDAASTFGIFGKSAGLAGKDLAKFAVRNTKLATDLASFHNSSPEAAIEAIGSAFRGEAEPMRQFGVLLDDATLKAEALSIGLLKPVKDGPAIKAAQVAFTEAQLKMNQAIADHGKGSLEAEKAEAALGTAHARLKRETEGTIGPLTAQQKVLAAQSAIFKQTSDAQGDFARTSGGLANQQRILKAQLENAKAEIGQKLLPVLLKITTWINDKGIPAAKAFGEKMEAAFRKIRQIVEAVWGIVKPILVAWKDSIGDLGATAKAVADGDYQTAMEHMNRFSVRTSFHVAETFKDMAIRMGAAMIKLPGQLGAIAVKIGARIVGALRDMPGNLRALAIGAGTAIIEGLVQGIAGAKHLVTDAVANLAGDIMRGFKNPLGIFSPSRVFKRYGIHIMEGLELGIQQGQSKVEAVLSKVLSAVERYGNKLRDLTSRRSDVISGFTGGAESVFGMSSTDAEGNSVAPTAAGLIAFQQQQRNQAVHLRTNVRKLLKMGLSRDLIQQMAAAGPSGYAQIAALAHGSAAQVAQLNTLNSQTNQALTGAGTLAGNALYADQISKAKDQQDAAMAIAKELRKVMREANDNQQIVIKLEGRTLQMSLLQLKRNNGKPLGLS